MSNNFLSNPFPVIFATLFCIFCPVLRKDLVNIPPLKPKNLLQIANGLEDRDLKIRNIDEVIEAIEKNNAQNVTPLEWVSCLYNKTQWDHEHPTRAVETADLIWNEAIENQYLDYLLNQLLLHRLVLYYGDQQEGVLPFSLVERFPQFDNKLQIKKKVTVAIIKAIRSSKPKEDLCKLSLDYLKLPIELLKQEKLPDWISIAQECLDKAVSVFLNINPPNNEQVNWLLRCLNSMQIEIQIQAVNSILTEISVDKCTKFPELIDWLKENYKSRNLRYRLTEKAQRALSDWIGAVNYAEFEKLAILVLKGLPLEKWERNQLERRRVFWEKYSDSFKNIKILLPKQSINVIGDQLTHNFDVLQPDGSESSEVCIFDFGDWLVVEIFRGPVAETRLLHANQSNNIFNDPNLSIKKIRRLGGETHDHKYVWQYFCQQWLKTKGIYLNPGKVDETEPDEKQLRKRNRNSKLTQWKIDLKKAEDQASQ